MSINHRKAAFLQTVPKTEIESCGLMKFMKFNFKFFDSAQEHGSSFDDLSVEEAKKLLKKLVSFSGKSLNEWSTENAGGNGLTVYSRYGDFPKSSDFKHPTHVPHDAMWGRFRLGNKYRLVGFVITDILNNICKDGFCYEKNTFYVVFIDKEHKFYKKEPP